ncbi:MULTISPECIES: CC0125/CC1285 family lipoprotein [Hyphobacterium]|uniref:Lipoprotein n=1 Tax=Hyphobacterium vulgare TaxID=1736751 RepID=A0ABV6ZXH8_9PROT
MMLRTTLVTIAAAAAVLAACATPTPYQAADRPGGYGYEQVSLESDRYRISFSGNSLTDRETVETYLLYRAAELALERGYETFTVVTRATDEDTRTWGPSRDPWRYSGFLVDYRYYHPAYGWYPWHDPFWDRHHYRETTRYEAAAEIVLGRGHPDDPNTFNAREVMANLGNDIARPQM